jgi:hypothetical protein
MRLRRSSNKDDKRLDKGMLRMQAGWAVQMLEVWGRSVDGLVEVADCMLIASLIRCGDARSLSLTKWTSCVHTLIWHLPLSVHVHAHHPQPAPDPNLAGAAPVKE